MEKKLIRLHIPYITVSRYDLMGDIQDAIGVLENIKERVYNYCGSLKEVYNLEDKDIIIKLDLPDDSLEVVAYREETDEELNERMKKRADRSVKMKEAAEKRKAKKEQEERELLAKLKAKYENN